MSPREVVEAPPTLSPARRAVLYALRRRGEAGVEDLADQLKMTESGVRQHLDALRETGLVEVTEVEPDEPRRGRRSLRYSVGAAADAIFPKAYGELTNELLSYVDDADPELLQVLFARRRERRIERGRERLAKAGDLAGRVVELARILDEDGYLAGVEQPGPGRFLVVEHNCAIWAVATRYGQACTSELEFITALLPDATVRRVAHMVAGARHCAYEISARNEVPQG